MFANGGQRPIRASRIAFWHGLEGHQVSEAVTPKQ
jgi:hypothetical protein